MTAVLSYKAFLLLCMHGKMVCNTYCKIIHTRGKIGPQKDHWNLHFFWMVCFVTSLIHISSIDSPHTKTLEETEFGESLEMHYLVIPDSAFLF